MRAFVTFQGIDEALENLHYNNKSALKYKLINTIRDHYRISGDVNSVKEIDTDLLVKSLWDTDDEPSAIRNRRKNFNSIKSTVNADLKKLYKAGKNPEGIIINQKNLFDTSNAVRSEILETFSYFEGRGSQAPLGKMADVLNVIRDFIFDRENSVKDDEGFKQLKEIKIEDILVEGFGMDEAEVVSDKQHDCSLEEILDDYDPSGYISEKGRQKAPLLAHEFDKMLSETEKYYNRYILIPAGKYLTGHSTPDKNEKKQSHIQIPDFYFGKFPVTNHLFELFVEKTGYVTTAERKGYGIVYKGRYRNTIDEKSGRKVLEWCSSLESEKVEGACWFKPGGPGSSLHGRRNHPVVQVTLEDAMAFAAWTGKRLPAEYEWEAASRTSGGLDYPWGTSLKEGFCNVESSAIGDTTPVDEFKEAANKFGVCDLLGNVLEWTNSSLSPSGNSLFITKGGSWVSGENIRLTQRVLLEAKTSSNILGFRCIAYK